MTILFGATLYLMKVTNIKKLFSLRHRVCVTIFELLKVTSSQADLHFQVTNNNQQLEQRLRDLLEAMGTSPNQIP